MERRNWTREQSLVAFSLYCRIPFGKIHHQNPEIIKAAEVLGRTPDALAMKMVNFASFDPTHKSRGVGGLSHASRLDEEIWNEFSRTPEEIAVESEVEIEKVFPATDNEIMELPTGPTEIERRVKSRLVQTFFRNVVLSSYDFTCSFCGLSIREMLVASHIIPWKTSVERRADPRNGISLCSFHDRAFDRGILAVSRELEIIVSKKISMVPKNEMARIGLFELSGNPVRLADRFQADEEALSFHRQNIFRS